ncbi:MAG: ribonuclease P protein component [Candidatus Pacebacteria bacterium]|nr:ribonuclease P protein component [Candidatus Paceibacterota bacterium]
MLKKKHRLTTLFFKRAAESEKKQLISKRSSLFLIKQYKTQTTKGGCAVVVSTKVAKNATERNRIKRVVYETLRLEKVCEQKECAYVILALPGVAHKTKEELKKDVVKLLKQS